MSRTESGLPSIEDSPAIPKICQRLELVRRREQLDIKGFHERLRKEAGLSLGYSAARTYHDRRPPPVEYIVAVSRTFQVDLEWLAEGDGDLSPIPTETARYAAFTASERALQTHAAIAEGFFGAGAGDAELEWDDLEVLLNVWSSARTRVLPRRRFDDADARMSADLEVAHAVGAAAAGLARALGLDVSTWGPDQIRPYLRALQPAFIVAHLVVDGPPGGIDP